MFSKIIKFALTIIFFICIVQPIQASDNSFDVTYTYPSVDSNAVDGDILFSTDKALVRADSAYSNKIFGILNQNPVLVYRDANNQQQPVSRTGVAQVNVTTLNGPITKGDYVTSSVIAGKGQKADHSGYILGTALTDFSGEGARSLAGNPKVKIGKITVALKIEYIEIDTAGSLNRLFQAVNSAALNNIQSPSLFTQVLRYLAAGTTTTIAFAISFLTFSRAITKGVEGIGRNPLARNAIQLSIIINAALTTAVALVGIIASFVILKI